MYLKDIIRVVSIDEICLSGESQSPTEIKASGGLQECAEEDVSKADAHSAARTLERS